MAVCLLKVKLVKCSVHKSAVNVLKYLFNESVLSPVDNILSMSSFNQLDVRLCFNDVEDIPNNVKIHKTFSARFANHALKRLTIISLFRSIHP